MSDSFFFIVGSVLGLIGLGLSYFALFRDRARGRRRCPKCWYDMSGTPDSRTCSECGHVAKRERKLHKTRRRWRLAALASVVLVGACACAFAPGVRKNGWVGQLPTSVLILLSPAPKDVQRLQRFGFGFTQGGTPSGLGWREQVFTELAERVNERELWAWQWRWMIRKHWDDLNPPWTFKMITRQTWQTDEQAFACPVIVRSDRTYLGLSNRLLRFRIAGGDSRHQLAFQVHSLVNGLSQPTDPWIDTAVACNENNSDFDMCVDRQTRAGEWQCVWKGTEIVQIARGDAVSPHLASDARGDALTRQLLEAMTFKVEPRALHVRWSNVPDALTFPTLALDFQLLCDGKPVATASAWWTAEDHAPDCIIGPKPIPFHYRVLWDNPIGADVIRSASGGEWRLRITGNEKLALRDVKSSRYWAGAVDVALHWEMANRNWINAKAAP